MSSLEQGVIPLFQVVSTGFYINNQFGLSEKLKTEQSFPIFPEDAIRSQVKYFFHVLVSHLEHHDFLRQRIAQSLIYSGNSKLRMNVLTSLLVISNYSSTLGRLFNGNRRVGTEISLPSNQQSVNFMWSFLSQLVESTTDMKLVMNVFLYFLQHIISQFRRKFSAQRRRSSFLLKAAEIATQTDDTNVSYYLPPSLQQGSLSSSSSSIHPKLLQLMIAISKNLTPVVIITANQNNAQMIRMSVPHLSSVEKYGGQLFPLIHVRYLPLFL